MQTFAKAKQFSFSQSSLIQYQIKHNYIRWIQIFIPTHIPSKS